MRYIHRAGCVSKGLTEDHRQLSAGSKIKLLTAEDAENGRRERREKLFRNRACDISDAEVIVVPIMTHQVHAQLIFAVLFFAPSAAFLRGYNTGKVDRSIPSQLEFRIQHWKRLDFFTRHGF
jgi:hypothetical protein